MMPTMYIGSDAKIQDVLMCIQMQKTLDDPSRMKFPNDEFYIKSREEMEGLSTFAPQEWIIHLR